MQKSEPATPQGEPLNELNSDEVIYTFDFETDPFKEWLLPHEQRIPKPFAVGAYCINTGVYESCWGDADEVVDFLLDCMDAAPDGSIWYAHNGGKFDVHYLKNEISGAMKIIGARLVECRIRNVIVRDSFAMLPVALEKFGGKLDIDYAKMEPDVREQHRDEIMEYLEADCRVLAKAIERFRDEFGLRLTMAGAAMKQLQNFHEFERIASAQTDATFRDFYFGGRVECIETGIIKGNFKTYDVNSMYPAVMRNFEHPVSSNFITYRGPYAWTILPRCDFAEVTARNWGCLPIVKDGKLTFREPKGRFFATGHEIRAGLETGTLEILDVHVAYKADTHANFAAFVDHFYNARLKAKAAGDKLLELFYKLVMNARCPSLAEGGAAGLLTVATENLLRTRRNTRIGSAIRSFAKRAVVSVRASNVRNVDTDGFWNTNFQTGNCASGPSHPRRPRTSCASTSRRRQASQARPARNCGAHSVKPSAQSTVIRTV